MSVFGVSDQEILRALIAERGTATIPTSSAVDQLVTGSQSSVLNNMKGIPLGATGDIGYTAQTPNYKIDPRGNRVGDAMLDAAGAYGEASGQFYDAFGPKAKGAQKAVNKGISKVAGRGGRRMAGKAGAALAALPGMGAVGNAAKVLAPGLGAVGGAMAVGDLVLGQESAPNKVMDATAMTIGGLLGSVGGPLGTAAGVGLGKFASDVTQGVFGGGKSAEERRMEEALLALRGGAI